MTQNNKICLNFETGEEIKDVMISLDNSILKWTSREFDEDFKKSIPSDPIFQKYPLLLELKKKLGFDVYEEYVVLNQALLKDEMLVKEGDYVNFQNNTNFAICIRHPRFHGYGFGLPAMKNRYDSEFLFISSKCSEVVNSDGYWEKDHSLTEVTSLMHEVFKGNYKIQGNIIQELSKHYRGEENKFEEVRKVLRV